MCPGSSSRPACSADRRSTSAEGSPVAGIPRKAPRRLEPAFLWNTFHPGDERLEWLRGLGRLEAPEVVGELPLGAVDPDPADSETPQDSHHLRRTIHPAKEHVGRGVVALGHHGRQQSLEGEVEPAWRNALGERAPPGFRSSQRTWTDVETARACSCARRRTATPSGSLKTEAIGAGTSPRTATRVSRSRSRTATPSLPGTCRAISSSRCDSGPGGAARASAARSRVKAGTMRHGLRRATSPASC